MRRVFVLLVAAGLVAAGCGDSTREGRPSSVRVFELSIRDRGLVDAGDPLRIAEGQKVELRWTTDEATTVHLHGYDLEASLEPGTPASMRFDATATGRFPVTSHGFASSSDDGHSHEHEHAPAADDERTLLYLEVHPR